MYCGDIHIPLSLCDSLFGVSTSCFCYLKQKGYSSIGSNRFFGGLGYLLISSYFSCHCRVLWCIAFFLPVLSFDLYAVGSAPKQALENKVKVLHGGRTGSRLTSVSGTKDPLSLFIFLLGSQGTGVGGFCLCLMLSPSADQVVFLTFAALCNRRRVSLASTVP